MIRKSDFYPITITHGGNHGQIRVGYIGRICRSALQQRNIVIAYTPAGIDCLENLPVCGYAGGYHHRFALGCRITDQFEVHHLERRYLIDRISQLFKEIDGLPVERRGKALHAETPRKIEKLRMPLVWSIGLLIKVVEIPAVPETSL